MLQMTAIVLSVHNPHSDTWHLAKKGFWLPYQLAQEPAVDLQAAHAAAMRLFQGHTLPDLVLT